MAATSRVASAGAVATAELAGRLPTARRRDMSGTIAHAILVVSVVVLAFPLYYAFVISTQTLDEVTSLPPKLLPSTNMLQNYADAPARFGLDAGVLEAAVAEGSPRFTEPLFGAFCSVCVSSAG